VTFNRREGALRKVYVGRWYQRFAIQLQSIRHQTVVLFIVILCREVCDAASTVVSFGCLLLFDYCPGHLLISTDIILHVDLLRRTVV
jgi:hypothetical protein